MKAIVCLGSNTVDVYADRGLMFPGGNAVNVAVIAARLGIRSAYIGCFGATDTAGQLIGDALEAENVDVSRVRRIAGNTARTFIGHRGEDRIFLGFDRGIRPEYTLEPEDFRFIAAFDALHTGLNNDKNEEMERLAASARMMTVDFADHWQPAQRDRFAPLADIAFLSHATGDAAHCVDTMRGFAAAGAALVVATRGENGAMALADGQVFSQSSAPARIVDTLGAGDAFVAGFLDGWLRGRKTPAALEDGARSAAAICAELGGFGRGLVFDPTSFPIPGLGGRPRAQS
ncbi:MAG TPA: PfkB family carbohydrate kinase [Paenirhodobacter sp.]